MWEASIRAKVALQRDGGAIPSTNKHHVGRPAEGAGRNLSQQFERKWAGIFGHLVGRLGINMDSLI